MQNEVLPISTNEYERINNIRLAKHKLLGRGRGSHVYEGYLTIEVAVKRIVIDPTKIRDCRELLNMSLKHKNILNVFAIETDVNFRYSYC